jgi:FixJ family two-component response regulator
MPEMDGSTLVSQLKAMRPGIKALFFSGYTDGAIVQHGILDPNVDFLQKPFSASGLVRKLREVIDAPVQ